MSRVLISSTTKPLMKNPSRSEGEARSDSFQDIKVCFGAAAAVVPAAK